MVAAILQMRIAQMILEHLWCQLALASCGMSTCRVSFAESACRLKMAPKAEWQAPRAKPKPHVGGYSRGEGGWREHPLPAERVLRLSVPFLAHEMMGSPVVWQTFRDEAAKEHNPRANDNNIKCKNHIEKQYLYGS